VPAISLMVRYDVSCAPMKTQNDWLTPLALSRNDGFSARELNQIRIQITLNLETILEAWHEHCG
jgi:hypothetical protein